MLLDPARSPRLETSCLAIVVALMACSLDTRAQANTNSASPQCTVADFKAVAITETNPTRREELARAWLQRNGSRCNEAQMRVLITNAPAWLGTAHSPTLVATMDGLLERHIANNPAKLLEHYAPSGRSGAAAAGPTTNVVATPPAPAPVVPPATGGVAMAAPVVLGAAATAPGGAAPAATAAANANVMVQVGTPDQQKASDPAGKVNPGRAFSNDQRTAVRTYFSDLRSDKSKCPPFMREDRNTKNCVSTRARVKPLKLNEPLDEVEGIQEIPLALREKLGPPSPGFRYAQYREDILLIEERTNLVTDIIVNLGGVKIEEKAG